MKQVVAKTLDNGITLLLENIVGMGTFSMGFYVKTGAMQEEKHEEGISHFIEHLMFKGTKNRKAKEISELIDNEGGVINAFTSREITCYYVKMLSSKIDIAIDVLSDMFLNSLFDEESIEKERNVIIEEIKMYDDIAEEIVHEKNIEYALRGVHSNNIAGKEEGLKKITRADIIKYLEDQYVTENLVISVSGSIDIDYVIAEIDKKMKDFRRRKVEREIDLSYEIKNGENFVEKESNQIHLCFNTQGLSSKSPLKYAAKIISNCLAGGMSSRLFQKIREDRGLAYSVYSYASNFINCGLFTVYVGTTKDSYKEVLKLIEDEFEDIKENLITEQELECGKNQVKSSLIFSLENTKSRMNYMAVSYFENKKIFSIDEMIEKIDKITMNDIREAASFMFDKNYYSHTIVGSLNNK